MFLQDAGAFKISLEKESKMSKLNGNVAYCIGTCHHVFGHTFCVKINIAQYRT